MVSEWGFLGKRVFVRFCRYGKQAGIFGGEFFVLVGDYGKWGGKECHMAASAVQIR